jgi:hypothetical protein
MFIYIKCVFFSSVFVFVQNVTVAEYLLNDADGLCAKEIFFFI